MITPLIVIILLLVTSSDAKSSWPLWTHYADKFVQSNDHVVDPDREVLTTSEGQGYAMFFALVANDQLRFDHLYRWTLKELAAGSMRDNLPAWSWGRRPDATWGIKDSNSASDADLWIAYDLIQAGRLWKRSDYTNAGLDLLNSIQKKEVNFIHGRYVLLPAQTGFEHKGTVVLNPSYMPLFLLRAAAQAQPAGSWAALGTSLPSLLHYGSVAGFASDWIQVTPDGAIHPTSAPGDATGVATGSYDAIRVYLWSGITSAKTAGYGDVLNELSGMANFMQAHSVPPEFVEDGSPSTVKNGPVAYSAALIPFLNTLGASAAEMQQQRRLNAAWSSRTGLYGEPPRYYDQNLAMFAVGYMEHRYRFGPTGELEVPWRR